MKRSFLFSTITALMTFSLSACASGPKFMVTQGEQKNDSDVALAKAVRADPTLTDMIQHSAGYAVFPRASNSLIPNDGVYGQGTMYEYGTVVGSVSLRQPSVGMPFNNRPYTEIIVFKTEPGVYYFKNGKFGFDEETTAVGVKAGASADAGYSNDVAVFTLDESGQPVQALVGGQTFNFNVLDRTNANNGAIAGF